MKQTFIKYLGQITEKLELEVEENWIYAHYTRGSYEKTVCILKNGNKTQLEYLEPFLKENGVSGAMKKEVEIYFMKELASANRSWKDFTNFLLKAVSMHLAMGIAIALSVFAGYQIGNSLDIRYGFYPAFTLIGTFSGIGVGGLTAFAMFQKYIKAPTDTGEENQSQTGNSNEQQALQSYPIIDVSIDQVRKAVREFSNNLPKGVYRTILVKEDNSIDFTQLTHILNGIPAQKYYMSKETYDLFEEKDKKIPVEMDLVQKAVDQYVKDRKQYPMLKFDPAHRVNYYELIQNHYLKTQPEIQFYITDLDGLITHIKPGKKLGNSSK